MPESSETTARITSTFKRKMDGTFYGQKEVFYSETLEIPTSIQFDRTMLMTFLNQRHELTFWLDCYNTIPSPDGALPNRNFLVTIHNRASSMRQLYNSMPEELKPFLAFDASLYILPEDELKKIYEAAQGAK